MAYVATLARTPVSGVRGRRTAGVRVGGRSPRSARWTDPRRRPPLTALRARTSKNHGGEGSASSDAPKASAHQDADAAATSPSTTALVDSVLESLPRPRAYATALDALCEQRVSGDGRWSSTQSVFHLDAALKLLEEMRQDAGMDVRRDRLPDRTVAQLIDAATGWRRVQFQGKQHETLPDAAFCYAASCLFASMRQAQMLPTFGIDTARVLTEHPPPRLRYGTLASLARLHCPTAACAAELEALPPLPSQPREEIIQASVGLGFLTMASVAILGEVVDPLVFHHDANDFTLILTLMFGSYALDRFTSIFQGRLADTVDKGLRRLVGGDREREAFCDAASFVISYRLGLPLFSFRPRAHECIIALQTSEADALLDDAVASSDGDGRSVREKALALYTIWLSARAAAECCLDKQLIESDTRQPRLFVQAMLAFQVRQYGGTETAAPSSSSSSSSSNTAGAGTRTAWEELTLRWAFVEATAMVRAHMGAIRMVANLMLTAHTPGQCVTELERTWSQRKRSEWSKAAQEWRPPESQLERTKMRRPERELSPREQAPLGEGRVAQKPENETKSPAAASESARNVPVDAERKANESSTPAAHVTEPAPSTEAPQQLLRDAAETASPAAMRDGHRVGSTGEATPVDGQAHQAGSQAHGSSGVSTASGDATRKESEDDTGAAAASLKAETHRPESASGKGTRGTTKSSSSSTSRGKKSARPHRPSSSDK